MKKLPYLIFIILLSISNGYGYSKPRHIIENSTPADHNVLYLDIYRHLTNMDRRLTDLLGRFNRFKTAENRKVVWARDVRTETKNNLNGYDAQEQLFELDTEKLHRKSAVSTDYNTMEVNFISGGRFNNTANVGIGPDTTPDYPLQIQRDAPQILIQNLSQLGGYKIIVDTHGYTTNTSSATQIVESAEWSGRQLNTHYSTADNPWSGAGVVISWGNKIWLLGGYDWPKYVDEIWYSEDNGYNWQEHDATMPEFQPVQNQLGLVNWPKCGSEELGAIYCFSGIRHVDHNHNALYKFDGRTWTKIKNDSGSDPKVSNSARMIYWKGYLWLTGTSVASLSGFDHDLSKSADGITWTKVINYGDAPFSGDVIAGLFIHGDELIIAGDRDIYSTSDGVTWVQDTSGSSNKYARRGDALFYSDGTTLYTAVGQADAGIVITDAWYSTNKGTWTLITSDLGIGSFLRRGHVYHIDAEGIGHPLIMGGANLFDDQNNSVWELDLDQDLSNFNNYFAIRQADGKEYFRIDEENDITWINSKLGLKLFNTTRTLEDKTTYWNLTTNLEVEWRVKTSTFTGYGGELKILNSTASIDHMFTDVIPSGIMEIITVTDDGGLDYSWSAGEVHVNGAIIITVGGSAVAANNDRTYLYSTVAGGTILSTSTTFPTGDYAMVSLIDAYNSDIEHIYTHSIIAELAEDIEEHIESVHSNIIVNGILVAADADGTNANDFTIASGALYVVGLDKHIISSVLYSAGSNHSSSSTTLYYHYESTWTNSSGNGVDFDRWDNGTGTTTVSNAKWYAGWIFIVDENEFEYVYPQTEHTKESAAVAESITFPPYHAGYTTPLAKFIFRGDQSAFNGKAYFIDIRPLHTFGFQATASYAVQDLWKTITGDSGSTDANLSYDSLGILGGDSLNSAMSGDNLTMNLDENVSITTITFSDSSEQITAGISISSVSTNYVKKAGDTMTGPLNLGAYRMNSSSNIYANAFNISGSRIMVDVYTSTGIQIAIDSLGGLGTVILTGSTYTITTQINVPDNIYVVGAGYSTYLDCTGWSGTVFMIDGTDNARFSNFRMKGNAGGGGTQYFFHDNNNPSTNNKWDNLYLENSDTHAIYLQDPASNDNMITNCTIINNDVSAILVYGDRSRVSLNIIGENGDIGVYTQGDYTVIQNNILYSNNNGVVTGAGDGTVISYNTINSGKRNFGIYIYNGDWYSVNGNVLNNNARTGIFIRNANYCTISNNTIKYSGNGYNDITMRNGDHNIISNNVIHSAAGYAEKGIYIYDTSQDIIVANNNLIGHDTCGIGLDSTVTDIQMSFNHVDDETVPYEFASGATWSLIWMKDGNIAIGTIAVPTEKLVVNGNVTAAAFNIPTKKIDVNVLTSTGINDAIGRLGTDGGDVYIPVGFSTVTTSIVIDQNYTRLYGGGGGSKLDASGWSDDHVINLNGKDYLTLENFRIEGYPAGGNVTHLIYDNNSAVIDSRFNNLRLINSDYDGIRLRNGSSSGNIISNSIIENSGGFGIYDYGSSNKYIFNNIIDCTEDGIYMRNVNGLALGNRIWNNDTGIESVEDGTIILANNLGENNYGIDTVSDNGLIALNTFNIQDNTTDDIVLSNAHGNTVALNSFLSSSGKSERGLRLIDSDNNSLIGGVFSGHDTVAIEIDNDSTNNQIIFPHVEGESTPFSIANLATNTLIWAKDGNIAIATTTAPTEKLVVNGTVKAIAFDGDGSGLSGIATASDIAIATTSAVVPYLSKSSATATYLQIGDAGDTTAASNETISGTWTFTNAGGILTDYGFYHDRGDPEDYDFELGDLTADGNWNDLDLSSIVPANAKAVNIHVAYTANITARRILFRRNGNVNAFAVAGVRNVVANIQQYGNLTVACDSNRFIEYNMSSPTTTALYMTVLGWWK